MHRTGVAVDHRVEPAAPVLPHPADAPLAVGDDATVGAEIAPHVVAGVRCVTVGDRQRFLHRAVAGGAVERPRAGKRGVVPRLDRPAIGGPGQRKLAHTFRGPLPPTVAGEPGGRPRAACSQRPGAEQKLSSRDSTHRTSPPDSKWFVKVRRQTSSVIRSRAGSPAALRAPARGRRRRRRAPPRSQPRPARPAAVRASDAATARAGSGGTTAR